MAEKELILIKPIKISMENIWFKENNKKISKKRKAKDKIHKEDNK